jgi:isoquinoline 1-oxidoreductase beta subunit
MLIENISRRTVLKGIAGSGGFVLGLQVAPKSFRAAVQAQAAPAGFAPSAFVAIDKDGTVTVIAHRSEMGQGVRTGLPMIVADELEADWSRVRVEQALGDEKYGRQDTDGSRSTRHFLMEMRETGATARAMLEQAAAKQWGVDASECTALNHRVHHAASGRSADFGELVEIAASMPVPDKAQVKLKNRSDWKYIGKDMPGVDLVDMTTGKAVYGADVFLPGMLTASIERCPVYQGKIASLDDKDARKVPGVKDVVQIPDPGYPVAFKPLGGVAVIADNTWAALEGRRKLKIEWDLGEHVVHDSNTYNAQLINSACKSGLTIRNRGDVDKAFADADKVIEADYFVPYFIHTPMEPPAAVAHYKDGKVEVWASTQDPIAAKNTVAEVLGVDPSGQGAGDSPRKMEPADVTVHVTLLGGGFGRKSKQDWVAEAAWLSRHAGVPIRVVWTREDEIRNGFYHAASAQHIKAALKDGKVTAWQHCVAHPTIMALWEPKRKVGFNIEYGLGFVDMPYNAIPNIKMENGEAEAHFRVGWYRSVNNIQHAYAINCFANELAAALGRDPLEVTLELIGEPAVLDLKKDGVEEYWNYGDPIEDYPIETGRLANALKVVAEKAGYGKPLPKGHGIGLAVHRAFLSYVATAVHVVVADNGNITIPRVDTAIDCGTYVNPERIRSQIEGAAVYGNTVARHGEITLTKGAVDQSNFHDYPVSRMSDSPMDVRVHIIENDRLPSGVGEPGVPPFTPALVNAIFQATGKRVRKLPIRPEDIAKA